MTSEQPQPGLVKSTQASPPGKRLLVQETTYFHYNGPLPPPDVLRQYGEIEPSFPERIMRMAEIEQASVHSNNDVVTLAAIARARRIEYGLIAIAIIGFGVSGLLAYKGSGVGASILGIGGLVPTITSALIGILKHKQSKADSNEPKTP